MTYTYLVKAALDHLLVGPIEIPLTDFNPVHGNDETGSIHPMETMHK